MVAAHLPERMVRDIHALLSDPADTDPPPEAVYLWDGAGQTVKNATGYGKNLDADWEETEDAL